MCAFTIQTQLQHLGFYNFDVIIISLIIIFFLFLDICFYSTF